MSGAKAAGDASPPRKGASPDNSTGCHDARPGIGRPVVGYHGTGLSAALRTVNRVEGFNWSQRDYDWLGGGIYFWEYAPKQALAWSKLRQKQYAKKTDKTSEDVKRATEPLAVVACMIR